jgi:HSP20 family protein
LDPGRRTATLDVEVMFMAKAMEKKEIAKENVVPFRETFPALPHWMERLDELLGERWAPLLPFRFAEDFVRVPPVDVFEEAGAIVVKAELPGMKKEEIDIHVAGELVTISGKKEKEEKVERKDYLRLERTAGEFTRTVKLPAPIVVEKVTAAYKDGVLELRAPKAEPGVAAGRKIDVA